MDVAKLNPLPFLGNFITDVLKQTAKEFRTPRAYVNPTTAPGGIAFGLGANYLGRYLEKNDPNWDRSDTTGLEMVATAPLWGTLLSLGGSTPQNDDMKWKRLGYDSKDHYDFVVERENRKNLDLSGRGDMDTDFVIQYEPQTDSYLMQSGIKPTAPGAGTGVGTEAATEAETEVPPSQQPPQGPTPQTVAVTVVPEQMDSNLQSTKDQLLGDAAQMLREGATNYGDFSKDQINNYYRELVRTDPEKAVEWGLQVNKSLFGWD